MYVSRDKPDDGRVALWNRKPRKDFDGEGVYYEGDNYFIIPVRNFPGELPAVGECCKAHIVLDR